MDDADDGCQELALDEVICAHLFPVNNVAKVSDEVAPFTLLLVVGEVASRFVEVVHIFFDDLVYRLHFLFTRANLELALSRLFLRLQVAKRCLKGREIAGTSGLPSRKTK